MGMKNRDGIARTLSRWQLALGRMAWWRFLLVVTIATFAAKLLIIVLCSLVADLDRTMDPGRAERLGCMAAERGDDTVRMEEIYELMEGMARYVEAEAGFRLGSYTEADKWLFRTDRSAYLYATGYNLVRLLDVCGAGKSGLYTGRILPLEDFLTTTENRN